MVEIYIIANARIFFFHSFSELLIFFNLINLKELNKNIILDLLNTLVIVKNLKLIKFYSNLYINSKFHLIQQFLANFSN
jgi:hypothetical protein